MKKKEGTARPSELYSHLGEYLGRVRWGGETFVVQKRGQRVARIISAGEIPPGRDGIRRFPRPDYVQVTPGEFRSRMSDYLARVRFGNQRVLITYRAKVVAVVVPIGTGDANAKA